jgi:exo-1,4-beta-D-glucosaminidase
LKGQLRLAPFFIIEALMLKPLIAAVRCVSAVVLLSGACSMAQTPLQLHEGWLLQSSRQVSDSGHVISKASYVPKQWILTTVPATVVAAQNAAGEFKEYGDIFAGMNLRKLPGMTYPIGLNTFANVPMDPSSPYAVPWWYRTQFILSTAQAKKKVALHFDGINYRANIWLNGKQVADAKDVAGAYHRQEFDVTPFITAGKNALAVEVFAPTEHDLGINWVDWNPTPPDKNMGLWGDVYLTFSGPVTVRYPQVITKLPAGTTEVARLTVNADLQNVSNKPIEGTLVAEMGTRAIEQQVKLKANEERMVSFTPEQFPSLVVKNPKLWWPVQMGAPNLQKLTVRFLVGRSLSEEASINYGIREITSELTPKGDRLFKVNRKPVLIRGGGWAQDMLLRPSRERTEAQIAYVLAMNLNTVRMEAQLESDHFFDLADQKGLLVMAGWCCCDMWEHWDQWQPITTNDATESLRSQMRRLRSHPSLLVWLNGSDGPPPATIERAYLQVEKETNWPNPVISSASAMSTTMTGPSGVKMSGPYDYEPPSYWLTDKDAKWGGAWGFNTETSPGPAIPVGDSIRKFIPKDHLWPIDEVWNFHAGGERFQTMDRFNEAMNKTYGPPTGFDDYNKKAQAMAYDGERAMFEAYAKNKYTSTGVIQWMMDNAWPSTIWHLYDYYLQPAGGYFGTKKACEPLHIQYSYDDRSVVVVNGYPEAHKDLHSAVTVLDANLKHIFDHEAKVDIEPDATKSVIAIPEFPEAPSVYFVKLTLTDANNRTVSSNFYWLPSKISALAWDKTPDTAWTPIAAFEDLTGLQQLPQAKLQGRAQRRGRSVSVRLQNSSDKLAFLVRLSLRDASTKNEVLPVLWDDNYVSLLPGESREINARYLTETKLPTKMTLAIDAWNSAPVEVLVEMARK